MSVSLWAWRPECDDEGCCGDCDLCKKADEMEEEVEEHGPEEDDNHQAE